MNFFVYTASVLVKKSKNRRNGNLNFPFSYSKCGRTADLAIAYWKKQIVLCPNINDNNKGWCKEFAETKVEKNKKTMKTVKNKKICIYLHSRFSTFRAYSVTADKVADSTERLTEPHLLQVWFLFYRKFSLPNVSYRFEYIPHNNTLYQELYDKLLCRDTSQG